MLFTLFFSLTQFINYWGCILIWKMRLKCQYQQIPWVSQVILLTVWCMTLLQLPFVLVTNHWHKIGNMGIGTSVIWDKQKFMALCWMPFSYFNSKERWRMWQVNVFIPKLCKCCCWHFQVCACWGFLCGKVSCVFSLHVWIVVGGEGRLSHCTASAGCFFTSCKMVCFSAVGDHTLLQFSKV